MLLSDLKTSLKYLLGDPNQERFSDATKGQLLNDASRLVCALSPSQILWSIVKKGTGSAVAFQYTVPTDTGRIIGITYGAKPARRRRAISSVNALTDGTDANPVWWFEDGKITFSAATGTSVVVFYYLGVDVTMATDGTECPLPDGLHPAVLEYAGFLGFSGVKENQEAMLHYQQVLSIIRNLVEDGSSNSGGY